MQEVDKLVSRLINLCKDKISNLPYSFKDEKIVHIMSGYDTRCACSSLESNLVEAGLCAPIIHDKGSFCHGRSTLVSRDTPVIYLSHKKSEPLLFIYQNLGMSQTDRLKQSFKTNHYSKFIKIWE